MTLSAKIPFELVVDQIEPVLNQIGNVKIRLHLERQGIYTFDEKELEAYADEQQYTGQNQVGPEDFSDLELVEALESRGYAVFNGSEEVDKITQALRCGYDCRDMIRSYFENLTGKIL